LIPARTLAEIVLLALVWGASFPIIRSIVPEFGVFALTFLRCAVGAAALGGWMVARNTPLPRAEHSTWIGIIGLIGNAIPFVLFSWATLKLSASYSSVINALVPVIGAVLAAWMLHERLTVRRTSGVLLGFAGVVLLVGAGPIALSPTVLLAALAAVLACFGFAYSQMLTKRYASHISAQQLTLGMLLVSAVVLVPFAAVAWPTSPPRVSSWLLLLVLGISNSAFATTRFMALVVSIGPVRAQTVPLLIPVFGLAWSAATLGEPLTPLFLLGTAVVLVAVWLVALEKRPIGQNSS
jgi:drug/metabolite transporter (DMT)-like permease